MEGSFAEAKENHCLDRSRYRGLSKMQIQAYMIAVVQNLKRMVAHQPILVPIMNLFIKFFGNIAKNPNQKLDPDFLLCQIKTAA